MATRKPKKKLHSFKDVQIAYLMHGPEGLEDLLKDGCSKTTLRRAYKEFVKAGREVGDFEQWLIQTIGSPGRGRSTPKVGETRSYKAQQIKQGSPFLRLPLNSLGIRKGKVVRVKFEDDKIVVSR